MATNGFTGPLPRLNNAIEMEIVAMIARGDTYPTIREVVEKKYERNISAGLITTIKKRNSEALATIQQALIQREQDDAEGLLIRTRRLLGRQLRDVERGKVHIRFNELTAISREMFHESRVEQGLDGAVATPTGDPKEKLKELQQLMEENDEVRLERIVFAKREQTNSPLHQPNEAGADGRDQHRVRVQGEHLQPPSDTDEEEVPGTSNNPQTP